jgi:hypothetical protein
MTQQQLAEIREEIANGQLLSYDDSRLLLAEVERQGIEIDHTHAIEPVLREEIAKRDALLKKYQESHEHHPEQGYIGACPCDLCMEADQLAE